ncbi:WG repeat-containing protein [Chitinophaga arvensicola]|nr:WG repeat-containing protein [Chitinophaga arvensicola]
MTFVKPMAFFAIGMMALSACKSKQSSEGVQEFVKEFDGKTLEEARGILQNESDKVEGFLGFMKNFKEEKPKHFKPEEEEVGTPYVQKTAAELEDRYTALLGGKMGFQQEIKHPNSVIVVDGDFRNSSEFADVDFPDFTTTKIFFHDGSSLEKSYAVDGNSAIPSPKIIDSVKADAEYSYPTKVEKLTLDKQNDKVTFKGASIRIDKMGDNRVRILMGNKAMHDYLHVEALNKDGKPLDYSSKNSGVNNPDDMNRLLVDFSKTLKSLITRIDKGSFKDVAALQAAIKKEMPDGSPFDEGGQDGYVEGFFKGNVVKVNVYLADDRNKVKKQLTLTNLHPNYTGLQMTQDEKTENYGFKDATGKFVIPATYKKLAQLNPFFFTSEDYNGLYYYRLDTATKTLVKLDFQVTELTPLLVTVAKPNKTNATGVMDANGNLVIPVSYDAIYLDPHEQIIYANKSEEDGPLQGINSLYDFDGHLISPDAYYTNGEVYHDGLLRVMTKSRKLSFIDNKGRKAIDLTAYPEAESFSNGLALVRNANNQYGYMNTKGVLVIPCTYRSASSFNEGIAMVSRANNDVWEYALINTKQELVLPFRQASSMSQSGEGPKKEYSFDDKRYNAKGVEIK